ncbi:MAG: tetratricopeptide repeat protein [Planctomycetes bacterium]|nr:tetratricopeptide repeat protein [Planctomycetota bacterium]
MTAAVVFAFATADGLPPVAGAAPYDVLARQVPRLLVTRLNGGGDRGVRFFPFLGHVDGQRAFLRLAEPLDLPALVRLQGQSPARLLCDGWIRAGALELRVVDAEAQRLLLRQELPFDPRRPLDVLPRLEFELTGLLGWPGRPQPPLDLAGEALGWFLVLKDALLRCEANLHDPAPDPLRPARRCLELAPAHADVQEVVLAFAAHWLRRGERHEEVATLLQAFADRVARPAPVLERAAALAQAAGDEANAAMLAQRAAWLQPERADLVERAAALLFRAGRNDEVRALVETAHARGAASVAALAQLAAACDRGGDRERRRELIDDLRQRAGLPVPVARLVVSFLLEDGRAAEARDTAARVLAAAPQHAMLQFEYGRACLLLDETAAAAAALERALALGVLPAVEPQARRLQRLAAIPGLWTGARAVEQALAAGDLPRALAAARALVRAAGASADAWYLLGLVQHRCGRERRAERLLRQALRRDEACADAHNRLGVLLLTRGALAAGHHHLQRAHALAPHDPSTLLHLAQAAALLGDHEAAERHVAAAEGLGAEPGMVAAVRLSVQAPPAA